MSPRHSKSSRILVITPGDPEGIGPEITWKAIRSGKYAGKNTYLLCVGAAEPFKKLKAPLVLCEPQHFNQPPTGKSPFVWLLPAPTHAPKGAFLPGYQSGWSIEKATRLVLEGTASGLVTGPISKERLQRGGYLYAGHTEFLAALCKAGDVTMMLANDQLRVSLATTHVGIKDLPQTLTRAKIRRAILQTAEGLRNLWGIRRPRIAVAALNPHAGESGLFGKEEIRLIQPELEAIQRLGRNQFTVTGPLPADTLFAKNALASPKERFDAVVCMYHDQGLIPVKLLDFYHTINITLGLPMIRTSVDHGVGFDIAGKGIANPASLEAAIKLAVYLANRRIIKNARKKAR